MRNSKSKLKSGTAFSGKRLWTGTSGTIKLLDDHNGSGKVLLQHARLAKVSKADGDESNRRRKFTISTETPDRHGDIVRANGIGLDNFKANPVVLFAHESYMPPIGNSPNIGLGEKRLEAEVDFFERDVYDFADTIFRIVNAGGLKATSIGFIPLEWDRLDTDEEEQKRGMKGFEFSKSDLLEFSIVPVPANPECVSRAFHDGAAMDPLVKFLEEQQDNWKKMHSVFEGLGFDEDHMNLVRRAAMGRRSLAQVKNLDDDEDEFSSIEVKSFKIGDVTQVNLMGGFPEKAVITEKVVAENKDGVFDKIGDTISINLSNAKAVYKIEDEVDGEYFCELLDSEQKDFVVQSIAGRKSKWPSREAFLKWAKKNGYSVEKVASTKNFWRITVRDTEEFTDLRVASLLPDDDEELDPTSKDCKVQAVGGTLKAPGDEEEPEDDEDEEDEPDDSGDSPAKKLDKAVDELINSETKISDDDMKVLTAAVEKLVKFLNEVDDEEEDEEDSEEDDSEEDDDEGKDLDDDEDEGDPLKDVSPEDLEEAVKDLLSEAVKGQVDSLDEDEDDDEDEED